MIRAGKGLRQCWRSRLYFHWRPQSAVGSRSSAAKHRRIGASLSFLTASTIERRRLMFRCAPVGLVHSFASLARVTEAGVQGGEVADLLANLDDIDCAADFDAALRSDPLGHFVRRNTPSRWPAWSARLAPTPCDDDHSGVGLLMRPALGQGSISIDKIIPALPVTIAIAIW